MAAAEDFNPRDHVRHLRGRGNAGPQEYLDVKHRVAWFRSEYPEGHIETTHITLTDQIAVFKAEVTKVTDGVILGVATGHGSETPADFGDYIEKAETKAIGRALAALGYGTQFLPDDGERIADAPVERSTAQTRPEPPGHVIAPRSGNVIPKTASMAVASDILAGFYTDIEHAPDNDALMTIAEKIADAEVDDDGLRSAWHRKWTAFSATA